MVAQNGSNTSTIEMTFNMVLADMNNVGQFKGSFLVDTQGLTVASAASGYDAETTSAMAALVRNVVEQVRARINLAEADEVAVRSNDKMRLISRYFTLGDQQLILVVVTPPDRPYRKLTNQAIKTLKTIGLA